MIHNEAIVRPLYVDSYVSGTAAAPGDDGELPPLLAAAPGNDGELPPLLAAAPGDDGQFLPLSAATPGNDRLSCPPFLYARHPNPTELYNKVPFPQCCRSGCMDPNLFGCPGNESVLGCGSRSIEIYQNEQITLVFAFQKGFCTFVGMFFDLLTYIEYTFHEKLQLEKSD